VLHASLYYAFFQGVLAIKITPPVSSAMQYGSKLFFFHSVAINAAGSSALTMAWRFWINAIIECYFLQVWER